MTPDHAAFADWDAAYVLGALTPADRRAFQAHLEDCGRCRAAVGELAAIPGLLAAARPGEDVPAAAAGDAAPPADLFDLVIARRRRERRGLRARVVLGIAAAAAVIAAVVLPVVWSPPPASTALALLPVEDSSMTATVDLTPVAWGTRIAIECGYPGSDWGDENGPWPYVLVVVDDAGESSQVSTWTAVPGEVIHLDAATAVPLGEISRIEVRTPSGARILSADVEG